MIRQKMTTKIFCIIGLIIHDKFPIQKVSSDCSDRTILQDKSSCKEETKCLSKNELKGLNKNWVLILMEFSSRFVSGFAEYTRSGGDTFARILNVSTSRLLINFASFSL